MPTRAFALEDGNIGSQQVITSKSVFSKDIDLTFKKKASGDIFKKENAASVKQAIKTLLLTNALEKPFLSDFGGDIQGKLFGLAVDNTANEIRDRIMFTIQKYEPRAEVLDLIVVLNPDRNSLHVSVEFRVINTGVLVEFSTVIDRVR